MFRSRVLSAQTALVAELNTLPAASPIKPNRMPRPPQMNASTAAAVTMPGRPEPADGP